MEIGLLHWRAVSYIFVMDNHCVANKYWIATALPSKMSFSSHATFTSIIDMSGRWVWSSLWMSVPPLSICALFSGTWQSRYTVTLHLYQWRWIWLGNVLHVKCRWYCELPHWSKFPMSLPLHINLSPENCLTDWLTLVQSAVCCPNCKAVS